MEQTSVYRQGLFLVATFVANGLQRALKYFKFLNKGRLWLR
jgi:hypothetical protein